MAHRRFLICAIALAPIFLVGCGGTAPLVQDPPAGGESWPTFTPSDAQQQMSREWAAEFEPSGWDYSWGIEDYTPTGDYLHSERMTWYETGEKDSAGIPLILGPDGAPFRNPVNVDNYGLYSWAKYKHGTGSFDEFLHAADELRRMVAADGSLRYPIELQYRDVHFDGGWVSGMAQGQALSVFARAYSETNDPKWIEAGNSVFRFMVTPTTSGGTMALLSDWNPTLDDRILFEEVVCHPACGILNGNMYAILGVYDWAQITHNAEAADIFHRAVETLPLIFPYYDLGNYTTYDMTHVTRGLDPNPPAYYHADHIALAHAMFTITGDQRFADTRDRWIGYIQ